MSDEPRDRREGGGTTVPEAAGVLGITEGAVRKRVERGKLAAERTPDGRLLVFLDATATDTTRDTTNDRPRQSRGDRYTRSLEEQVAYLRQQLDQEREARTEERRRHDTVVAQLTQANAALASRIPEQLEASATQEARETPETVEGEPERAESRPEAPGAQEGVLRRLQRRVFGR